MADQPQTAAELRAAADAAKPVALANFRRDWGTESVAEVLGALRQTIPGSDSPADAARKAHALLMAGR
jgi:hypothetical protein